MPPINGKQEIRDNAGANTTIVLDGNQGDIAAGGGGLNGNFFLKDDGDQVRISMRCKRSSFIEVRPPQHRMVLDAASGHLYVGGDGVDGSVDLRTSGGLPTARLEAGGNLWLGGNGAHGSVDVRTNGGVPTARLEAGGNLWLGGNGADGDLMLFQPSTTNTRDPQQATVHVDGASSQIHLRVEGEQRVRLDGAGANVWLGGRGADGDLMLFKSSESDNSNHQKATIHLDGQAGDIVLKNADCAEDFVVAEPGAVEPGTVMVLGAEGAITCSTKPYDRRVAGVVSGAGGYRPGIVLDRQDSADRRLPVALVGKVYCKVEAGPDGIEVGDLLTTSATPGHAMKAGDASRAFGAVLGKALRSARPGRGLIPILVTLQ